MRHRKTKATMAGVRYVATEGVLYKLELDWREGKKKSVFWLEERDTRDRIQCRFKAAQAPKLIGDGDHATRIFVEGTLTESQDGNKEMDVDAFRIIPTPISTDEIHRLRLRLPDDQDAVDYIRNLRADLG